MILIKIWWFGAQEIKEKTIAKKLIAQKIDFYWICDNPKKNR